MNCKKGDIGMVKTFVGVSCAWCGRRRTVFPCGVFIDCQVLTVSGGVAYWQVPGREFLFSCCSGPQLFTLNTIADGALRPIRDPGDDAVDETLVWIDVPHGGQLVDLNETEKA